jgi:hypothetical protein
MRIKPLQEKIRNLEAEPSEVKVMAREIEAGLLR